MRVSCDDSTCLIVLQDDGFLAIEVVGDCAVYILCYPISHSPLIVNAGRTLVFYEAKHSIVKKSSEKLIISAGDDFWIKG